MTEHDEEFPDAGRLRDAMAEEVDRPGLEGPTYDAVMRSAAGRIRRRRVTLGATFAVAAVALATSVTVSRIGGNGGANGNATANGNGTANADGTANGSGGGAGGLAAASGASSGTPTKPTTATPAPSFGPGHVPGDVILKTGTAGSHTWRLAVHYYADAPASSNDCASLSIYVDDVWTNAGGGGVDCILGGEIVHRTQPLAAPGFAAISIIDTHHTDYGSIVAGNPNPAVTSVVARCGNGKTYETVPFAADGGYYYTFVFQQGSGVCPTGSLSFYDASHKRVAYLDNVGLGLSK